jgi:hypothetical protein
MLNRRPLFSDWPARDEDYLLIRAAADEVPGHHRMVQTAPCQGRCDEDAATTRARYDCIFN